MAYGQGIVVYVLWFEVYESGPKPLTLNPKP